MASLYYGLLALDDETLRAIGADAALTRAVVRNAHVLPTAARAIRVEGGVVRTPGGTHADGLWEDLLSASVADPAAFVDRLLRIDDGRMAHFYATMAVLPPRVRAYSMGPTSGERSRDGFRRLYSAFETALGDWRADALAPPPEDGPAEVLFDLEVHDDGRLAGPPWRDFWRQAFESDGWPPAASTRVDTRLPMDAAALIATMCPERCSADRRSVLSLLQRIAPDPVPEDAAALLGAARVRVRFPTLADEIARMDLGAPGVFQRLGAVAARLERLDQPVRTVSLMQFQSAVAILSRLRLAGAPATLINEHLEALASLPVAEQGYEGGVAHWIGSRVFELTAENASLDSMLHALGGGPWQSAGARLEWEEIHYRVDLGATEGARLRHVLDRFTVNAVPTAVALARLASDAPARVAAGDAEALLAESDATLTNAVDVEEVWWYGVPAPLWSASNVRRELAGALSRLRPSDTRRVDRVRRLLALSADAVAADALSALVYAFALHDEDHPFLLRSDPSRRHRLHEARDSSRLFPWQPAAVPAAERAARLIEGSLLGLDTAMPDLTMRRMESRRPETEPNMAPGLAARLRQTAARTSPWLMSAGEIEAVALARARGQRVARAWFAGGAAPDPDAAGISGPRAGWLRWSIARRHQADDLLRVEDLVRLGFSRGQAGGQQPGAGSSWLALPAVPSEARGRRLDPRLAIAEPAMRTCSSSASSCTSPKTPRVFTLVSTRCRLPTPTASDCISPRPLCTCSSRSATCLKLSPRRVSSVVCSFSSTVLRISSSLAELVCCSWAS
jgi:hypothetical protein